MQLQESCQRICDNLWQKVTLFVKLFFSARAAYFRKVEKEAKKRPGTFFAVTFFILVFLIDRYNVLW